MELEIKHFSKKGISNEITIKITNWPGLFVNSGHNNDHDSHGKG
jgi:hypothetical protein